MTKVHIGVVFESRSCRFQVASLARCEEILVRIRPLARHTNTTKRKGVRLMTLPSGPVCSGPVFAKINQRFILIFHDSRRPISYHKSDKCRRYAEFLHTILHHMARSRKPSAKSAYNAALAKGPAQPAPRSTASALTPSDNINSTPQGRTLATLACL